MYNDMSTLFIYKNKDWWFICNPITPYPNSSTFIEQVLLVSCMDKNTFPIIRHGSMQAYPAQVASLFLRVCLLLLICK